MLAFVAKGTYDFMFFHNPTNALGHKYDLINIFLLISFGNISPPFSQVSMYDVIEWVLSTYNSVYFLWMINIVISMYKVNEFLWQLLDPLCNFCKS